MANILNECRGCVHEMKRDNICVALGICTYCKRAYFLEEEQDCHEDMYVTREEA